MVSFPCSRVFKRIGEVCQNVNNFSKFKRFWRNVNNFFKTLLNYPLNIKTWNNYLATWSILVGWDYLGTRWKRWVGIGAPGQLLHQGSQASSYLSDCGHTPFVLAINVFSHTDYWILKSKHHFHDQKGSDITDAPFSFSFDSSQVCCKEGRNEQNSKLNSKPVDWANLYMLFYIPVNQDWRPLCSQELTKLPVLSEDTLQYLPQWDCSL